MNIENMFDKPDVKQLVHAFSLLDDENDIQAFLTDICTPREICDLSQRLQVARYLDEGEPYVEVQARTGASSTTVSRVSKALNGEYGGYRKILIKLEDGESASGNIEVRRTVPSGAVFFDPLRAEESNLLAWGKSVRVGG